MRRLHVHEPVAVSLDREPDALDCRVSSVVGSVATLKRTATVTAHIGDKLRRGSLGFLTFDHAGRVVALRGVTTAGEEPSRLEFVVVDGIQLTERRNASRTALVTPARLSRPSSTGAAAIDRLETSTVDLSLGGALLARTAGMDESPEWCVEIFVGRDVPWVSCRARAVRLTSKGLAVAFVDLDDSDRVRLAHVIVEQLRR